MRKPKEGDLQVWWKPQVPMKSFIYPVDSVDEAALIINVLGLYDLFQYENKVKGDYANAGGLEVYEDDDWVDWWSDDFDDIHEYMNKIDS